MIRKEGRNWRRCCRNRIFVLIRIISFPGNRVEITFGNWIKIVADFLNLQQLSLIIRGVGFLDGKNGAISSEGKIAYCCPHHKN